MESLIASIALNIIEVVFLGWLFKKKNAYREVAKTVVEAVKVTVSENVAAQTKHVLGQNPKLKKVLDKIIEDTHSYVKPEVLEPSK